MMMGSRRKRDGEHGQVLVLFTFAIILLMGLAAIVIDAGLLRTDGVNRTGFRGDSSDWVSGGLGRL
jgi:hypothetical protein